MYPNWKKGLKVALIAGSVAGILFFALVCFPVRGDTVNECGFKWPSNPWRHWVTYEMVGLVFLLVGSFFGLLAAFRPDFRSKK